VIKYDVIILSGGKGTRVKRFTKNKPKCLIDINGKPFLYHQLIYLKKNNIKNVILSVGYLSEMVETYVQKYIKFINVKIVSDGKKLLGTGGAIKKSLNHMKNNFFIMYGDSYFDFNLKKMKQNNSKSIMAIYKNKNKYDKSNIELKQTNEILYYKSKIKKKLFYIDYGVSYLNKAIFKGTTTGKKFDLSTLFCSISNKGMLKGFLVKKRFYEIGSYNGIKELKRFLK
tara:strand:+ start:34292 stop:34972 length:681 start_codon:yes stop_codon:yes gene_type:complete